MADRRKAELSFSIIQEQLEDVLGKPKRQDIGIDQLRYMADLLAELEVMAKGADLDTLAGIVGLAVAEAHVQLGARRRGL